MSHFAVMVVGDNVEEQLGPYHEFECTGVDDEYVEDIDQTEEALAEYDKRTETRYKDPEGNLHDPYQDQFYREPTPEEEAKHKPLFGSGCGGGISWYSKDWGDGKGYRAKVHCAPEGWEEVKVSAKDFETFAKFIEEYYGKKIVPFGEEPDLDEDHKYGYALVDKNGNVTKVIDRTNENKKWDWYSIGGRWTGFFKMKSPSFLNSKERQFNFSEQLEPATATPTPRGVLGKPGLQRMNDDYTPPGPDRADQCIKADIDIEGMRNEAGEKASKEYDLFAKTVKGLPSARSWKEIREKHGDKNIDAARKEYHQQPVVKALQKNKETTWFEADDFLCSREQFIERARKNAFTTFAVLKDGMWYERGEMGWWGVVHDEQDNDEWIQQFNMLIDNLPDNTLLTVVDCHI